MSEEEKQDGGGGKRRKIGSDAGSSSGEPHVDPVAIAKAGDIHALRALPIVALTAVYEDGQTLAPHLVMSGCAEGLRVLHELPAGASLSVADAPGQVTGARCRCIWARWVSAGAA